MRQGRERSRITVREPLDSLGVFEDRAIPVSDARLANGGYTGAVAGTEDRGRSMVKTHPLPGRLRA